MCDANDFDVGALHGQRKDKKLHANDYATRTLDNVQKNYATTKKELLDVVFAFEKFHPYLVGSKVIVHIDHSAFKHLMQKKDAKQDFSDGFSCCKNSTLKLKTIREGKWCCRPPITDEN